MLGASEVRDLLERHGLEARRSLGQNFVVDPNTVRAIAALAAVGPGDRVVEVGPGLGSLTLALAETGADVLAVEKDRLLLEVLREVLADAAAADDGGAKQAEGGPAGTVRVVEGDALLVDWPTLLADWPTLLPDGPTGGSRRADPTGAPSWALVANLPYNVAVPVVMRVLSTAPSVERLVVMVQLEVAERLCAAPGSRTIGIPTIRLGWYASARVLRTVGPEVFSPRPRVRSAVVGIERRPPPSERIGPGDLFPLVDRAYRQRRKMLRSTLSPEVPVEVFDAAGIDPRLRPEQLSLADWVRLAEAAADAAGAT